MTIQLVIRDGSPDWFFSNDIWVVPGNDPNSSPGNPMAGQSAYVWARVSNTGSNDATNVRVNFYWANPALDVLRSTSTLIGYSYVDLPAGGSQDVLCLSTWTPVLVNEGHECLVAEAVHPGDPLPSPLPDSFDPPSYRQIAQKNLTVVTERVWMDSKLITLVGSKRIVREVVLTAEVGGVLSRPTLIGLGLKGFQPAKTKSVDVGLDLIYRKLQPGDSLGIKKMPLFLEKGCQTGVYANIQIGKMREKEYQLVKIVEKSGDKVVGGLGFIVIPADKEK
jgi:hypothetical protein